MIRRYVVRCVYQIERVDELERVEVLAVATNKQQAQRLALELERAELARSTSRDDDDRQ